MYTAAQLRLSMLRLLQFFSFALCVVAGEHRAAASVAGITVTLSDAVGTDLNGDGVLNPGDSIIYTVNVKNGGEEEASGLVFTATPDALTPLVSGSVRSATGVVTVGNTPNDTTVRVALATLAAGATQVLTFEVQLPASAARPSSGVVSATAAVSDGETQVTSDDPSTATALDATTTEVVIPAPVVVGPSITPVFSGGGFSCSVSPGPPVPAPLLLLGVTAVLFALLRRRTAVPSRS